MKKAVCLIVCLLTGVCFPFVCASADSATSSVVINGDTGEVLYSKREDMKLANASTTKIMTALILCELYNDPSKKVRVSEQAVGVEGSSMGLKAGEEVSVSDLLHGIMLSSGNDAANAAAIFAGGSLSAFVALMNEKAKRLGLNNTHYETPSGLDGKTHYTTALDLALLARAALQNELFASVCAKKHYVTETGEKRYLKNHNKLLFMYDDVIGVKTGYTKKAGRCLVSAAKSGDKFVIAVTLNDKNDWADHRELIDTGYSLLGENKRITDFGSVSIPIASGGREEIDIPQYRYYSRGNIKITARVNLPNMLYLPVKSGETLGTVEYISEYRTVKRVSIISQRDIPLEKQSGKKLLLTLYKLILTGSLRTKI